MKNILILLFCLASYLVFGQTDPKVTFDNLVTAQSAFAAKWPHPTTNTSTTLTPCGQGSNNGGTLSVTNFDPIRQVVRVNYPYHTNYASGSFDSVTWNSIGTTNGSNKEYKIQYQHEHSVFPNRNNLNNEFFEFQFNVTNNTGTSSLSYVIFYQNESYYYSENNWNVLLSGDNYYGSWGHNERDSSGLRNITVLNGTTRTIKGIFRVRGNPKNNPIYTMGDNSWQDDITNDWKMNRWAEQPRMGRYRFLVVVTSNPASITLPFLKDATVKYNNNYYTPFYWRNCIGTNFTAQTAVAEACYNLKVYAQPDMNAPLRPAGHVDNPRNPPHTLISSAFTNSSFHTWDNFQVDQIPLVQNIENYTQLDYNFNKQFTAPEDYVKVRIDYFDENNINWASGEVGNAYPNGSNKILIATPPSNCSTSPPTFKREHAGINYAENGLKYGKFRAKVKFAKMYTPIPNKIWTGINNTFWFAPSNGQSQPWAKINCGSDTIHHTEFDIEYFPKSNSEFYYHYAYDKSTINGCANAVLKINEQSNSTKQFNIAQWNDKGIEDARVAILYSLYDMHCPNVVNPIPLGGSTQIVYQGNTFTISRDLANLDTFGRKTGGVHSYKMVPNPVTFTETTDDSLFAASYYYEMEWTPSELIFRRGATLATMEVISYYNGNFSRIPHEYMTWIIAHHQLHVDVCSDFSHIHKFLALPNQPIISEVTEVFIE
jgi:hypothetical protein